MTGCAHKRGSEHAVQFDDDQDQPAPEVISSNDGLILAPSSVLPEGGAPEASGGRRRTTLVAGATAAVLVVGGGAWAVGSALSGGGSQPESVVPANAVFYAEVDLDPSAGQKVDAFRFLHKFPALKDAFNESGGLGPGLEKLFDGTTIDYATDVKPWLGKRYAVAMVPGAAADDGIRVELVLQATDEAKAKTGLDHLLAGVGSSAIPGVSAVVRDGYAIIGATMPGPGTSDQAAPATDTAAALSTEASTASLQDNADYARALAPYGSGIVTLWSDNGGLTKLTKTLAGGLGMGLAETPGTGHSISVLRFDGDTLEIVGASSGSPAKFGAGGVPALLALPDSTLAAIGGAGVGAAMRDAVAPYLESFGRMASLGGGWAGASSDGTLSDGAPSGDSPDPADSFGPIGDPAGWPTLFGDQTVVAVGGGTATDPSVGVHVVGGQDTIDAVLGVADALGSDAVAAPTDGGVLLATDQAWLDALAAGGAFGSSERFRDAVPDASSSSIIGFADIDGLVEQYGSDLSAKDHESLDPLSAVGLSVQESGDSMTYRIRLLTD